MLFNSYRCLSASVFTCVFGSVFAYVMVLLLFPVFFSVLCSLLCLCPYVTVLHPFVFIIRHSVCCFIRDICFLPYWCLLLVTTLISPSISSLIFILAMVWLIVWLVCRSRLAWIFVEQRGTVVSASDSWSGGCGFDPNHSSCCNCLGKAIYLHFLSTPVCKMGTRL